MNYVYNLLVTYNNYDAGFSDNLFPNRGDRYSTGVHITPGHNLDTIAVSHASFTCVHFWGKDWSFIVKNCGINGTVVVDDVEFIFYGTTSTPEVISRAAIGAIFCDACCQEGDATTLECVEDCAEGQTMRSDYCYDVSEPEPKCVVR